MTGPEPLGLPPARRGRLSGWIVAMAALLGGALVVGIAVMALRAWLWGPSDGRAPRVQIADGIAASGRVRSLVGAYILQRAALPADNRALGLPPAQALRTRALAGMQVRNGKVVLTFGGTADLRIRGRAVTLSPEGNAALLRWRCESAAIPAAWLPDACRD